MLLPLISVAPGRMLGLSSRQSWPAVNPSRSASIPPGSTTGAPTTFTCTEPSPMNVPKLVYVARNAIVDDPFWPCGAA